MLFSVFLILEGDKYREGCSMKFKQKCHHSKSEIMTALFLSLSFSPIRSYSLFGYTKVHCTHTVTHSKLNTTMEYNHYMTMLFGCSAVLLVIEVLFFALLSKRLLAELIENLFDINCIDQKDLSMSYFGHKINFSTNRRFRFSLSTQVAFILWMMILLLLDGCIMNIKFFSNDDICPPQPSDCFIGEKFSSPSRFICQSGEKISNQVNSTILCFIWVYPEQSTLGVLNELGICSSVFSLLCHAFKFACRISRKLLGLLVILCLLLGLIILFIISILGTILVSITTILLLAAFIFLLINVIQLLQFTWSLQRAIA